MHVLHTMNTFFHCERREILERATTSIPIHNIIVVKSYNRQLDVLALENVHTFMTLWSVGVDLL